MTPPNTTTSTRVSPPTERVIAVINLLTAHPGRRFTLTEIIGHLDITKATCHALLRSLTRAGYLVRHPDKTYTLGPALVAAGRVAQDTFSALRNAVPEMSGLSDQFGAAVSAAAVVGDELVVVERVGASDAADHLEVGHRMPFVPPLGVPFVAWGHGGALEEWIARSRRTPLDEERQRWNDVVTAVREQGYGVERMSESWGKVRRLVGELADEQLSSNVRELLASLIDEIGPDHYLPSDLDGATEVPVSVIYAPVLDERGHANLSIALNMFRTLTPRQAKRAGTTLAATCRRLSTVLGLSAPG